MKFHATMKTASLSVAALVLCATGAWAQTKVTLGVGHMCCGGCITGAKSALMKVASDVAIDDKTVTVTLKDNQTNIVPVLDALRTGGFPATRIDAGSGPVTMTVAHLCCGKCVANLKAAITDAKLEAVDLDAMSIKDSDKTMVVKAKDGMKLDLAPVLLAMEKAGFSPSSIRFGAAAASVHKAHKIASAK